MSSSPWGIVQNSSQILRGVRNVSTAGHGGIMVSIPFANKHFSKEAIAEALVYGNYYCYEEDCGYAIPLYELKDKWNEIFGDKADKHEKTLLKTLSSYFPNYLISKGITPLENEYSEYKKIRERDKMQAEKNPDLIISAWGTWYTNTPGVIKVETADGKEYLIKEEGYSDMTLKLLSKCQVIKEITEEAI
ncbi:MAG: hypothetical protein K0R54_524 [Clostridiaceae bacterium]|jgi:hypothetical protein|nr:hypothetical protein [Clostridiaceae bacterium]